MKKSIIITIIAGLCAFACSKSSDGIDKNNVITISGAWALYPMTVKWAEEFNRTNPEIFIDISAGGAGKGMTDALSGVVDLGMVSREINAQEKEKGAWWISVVKDAVVATINAKNPHAALLVRRGVTGRECEKIWIKKEILRWNQLLNISDPSPVRVYTRSDACGAAETWARFMKGGQEDLQGVGVFGDPGLAEAVQNDTLGIGYNNINFAYDAKTKKPVAGIIILPLDLNANGRIDGNESFYGTRDGIMKAITDSVYPSPPARDLHFVSRGKPLKKAVVTFLNWIMNEGRKYVPEAGYVDFSAEKLQNEKKKLLNDEHSIN